MPALNFSAGSTRTFIFYPLGRIDRPGFFLLTSPFYEHDRRAIVKVAGTSNFRRRYGAPRLRPSSRGVNNF